jgi:hypothetical protein
LQQLRAAVEKNLTITDELRSDAAARSSADSHLRIADVVTRHSGPGDD